MHWFKRHYLLCSLVLSFTIPLVTFDIAFPQLNEELNSLYSIEKLPEQIVSMLNNLYPESNSIELSAEPEVFPTEMLVENNISAVRTVDYAVAAILVYAMVAVVKTAV